MTRAENWFHTPFSRKIVFIAPKNQNLISTHASHTPFPLNSPRTKIGQKKVIHAKMTNFISSSLHENIFLQFTVGMLALNWAFFNFSSVKICTLLSKFKWDYCWLTRGWLFFQFWWEVEFIIVLLTRFR